MCATLRGIIAHGASSSSRRAPSSSRSFAARSLARRRALERRARVCGERVDRIDRSRARPHRASRHRRARRARDARATRATNDRGARARGARCWTRDDDATTRDDDDDARDATTRDDDDDARDAASPGRAPIGGINEDGYFGDADGAWLPSDRVPLVLRAREAAMAAGEDYGRDVRTFLGAFGWPIAASAFCVFLLIFALEEFGGAKTRRRGP